MRALSIFALALASGCNVPEVGSAYAAGQERRAVVVELFSSEGCSSCPPADAVLRDLATKQPIAGAEIVALELHVDYWNSLGWTDPFSSAAFSARQRAYSGVAGTRGSYTPQMIVDGDKEFVGSQSETARTAIAAAAKRAKAKVSVSLRGDRVTIGVADLPEPNEPADVWLAITEANLKTAVPRGENAGATLAHGPVVRRLDKIGAATRAQSSFEAPLRLDAGWVKDNVRVVAFVQQTKSLHIVGAGALAMR